MATTTTVIGSTLVQGPQSARGELRAYLLAVQISGTYLTASKPSFDVLDALQKGANRGQNVTAVAVRAVMCWRDIGWDSHLTRLTAPNAQIVLSSTGNKVATFRLDSGATNGATGSEIADATALDAVMQFMVLTEITGAL